MLKPLLVTAGIWAMSSCNVLWCGETDLGNDFVLTSDKPIQIIHCTTRKTCCSVGYTGVPGGVVEYGSNDAWIVAKRSTDEYWIIDKRFHIDWRGHDVPGRQEFYESHITGNLSLSEFEHLRDSLNIEVEMIEVEH